jgi:ATP-binding cassette subfamily B protein
VHAFEGVSFYYPDADEPALSHISFTAPRRNDGHYRQHRQREKTTLLHLILRFYDVTGGRIALDGVDVRDTAAVNCAPRVTFRRRPCLFSGSIADNIRWGRPDATDEQIAAASSLGSRILYSGARWGFERPPSRRAAPICRADRSKGSPSRARRSEAEGLPVRRQLFGLGFHDARGCAPALAKETEGRHRCSSWRSASRPS